MSGPKRLIGVVVHAELDCYSRRFQRQDIALQSALDCIHHHLLLSVRSGGEQLVFFRMSSLAKPGSVSAPAHIAEGQVPFRMPGQGIGFDVGGVEPLLRDALSPRNTTRSPSWTKNWAAGAVRHRAEDKDSGADNGLNKRFIVLI